MGFFSSTDKNIKRTADESRALSGAWGEQAGGASDRSGALWDQQGDLYGKIGDMLFSGAFNTPGVSFKKERDWWKKLGGTYGTGPLKADTGGDILSYGSRATGMLTDAENEANQAIRDRMASQQRSLAGGVMDQLRNSGTSGWGGVNPMALLAAQKNLQSQLASGTISANADIRDYLGQSIQQGYSGMERAQGKIESLKDRPGHSAGLGEYLAYMNADPRGSSLDWSKMAQSGLSGQGESYANTANMYKGAQKPGWGQTLVSGLSGLAGAAMGSQKPWWAGK